MDLCLYVDHSDDVSVDPFVIGVLFGLSADVELVLGGRFVIVVDFFYDFSSLLDGLDEEV